jgi:hypothetical protein
MRLLNRLVRSKAGRIAGITTLTLVGVVYVTLSLGQLGGVIEPWPFALSWCADGPGRPIDTPELEAALQAEGIETVRKMGMDCSGGDVATLDSANPSEYFLACNVRWRPDSPLGEGVQRSDPLRHPGADLLLGNVSCSVYTDDASETRAEIRSIVS